ncbi:DNA-binding NarL/FixJ family response regulator [Caballeronia udeis]|uniref:DNA-binding NarL/FixJ family response regulator n=1 Tax=Caballeronia udeis TaxID=1232866 RepID=A0ABW8MSR1_9BURK
MPVPGLFQLDAQPRSPLDRLSQRELIAIRLFGEGLSHKEVAQRSGNRADDRAPLLALHL